MPLPFSLGDIVRLSQKKKKKERVEETCNICVAHILPVVIFVFLWEYGESSFSTLYISMMLELKRKPIQIFLKCGCGGQY